jgi:hypothetical protein
MIWSIVSVKGPGRVYVVNGIMNAQQYLDVLQQRLQPQLCEWYPDGNCVYMQDSTPCDKAKVVEEFFEGIGLEILPWPGNSPDLNPIEGIWHNLKNKVNQVITTNKRELIERIVQVWHRDPDMPSLIAKYYDTMPNRIKAVIKSKGGATKY